MKWNEYTNNSKDQRTKENRRKRDTEQICVCVCVREWRQEGEHGAIWMKDEKMHRFIQWFLILFGKRLKKPCNKYCCVCVCVCVRRLFVRHIWWTHTHTHTRTKQTQPIWIYINDTKMIFSINCCMLSYLPLLPCRSNVRLAAFFRSQKMNLSQIEAKPNHSLTNSIIALTK